MAMRDSITFFIFTFTFIFISNIFSSKKGQKSDEVKNNPQQFWREVMAIMTHSMVSHK